MLTFITIGCLTLVRQHPMKSLSSVCWSICLSVNLSVGPSVCLCLSVCPSVHQFFSDIVHDDSWLQYLVTYKARFLKTNLAPQIWHLKWTKIGPKTKFFCHFLKFGLSVFLEIAYNDSLQQFLTSSTDKIYEIFGAQIWAKGAKIGPKARFFAIFSSLVH